MSKEKILDFIKSQDLAVVTTVDKNGRPEAALVAISETEDLELIFGSLSDTRKNENIKNHPDIAVVIGLDDKITIQYEGKAVRLEGEEEEEAKQIHIKKLPGSAKYADMEGQEYFKITPKWIRYSDFNHFPEKIFELNL